MAKKDHDSAGWAEEMKQGWEIAIPSRLAFHGALEVDWVVRYTGHCQNTVRRWFRKLVERGIAVTEEAHPDRIRKK